MSLIRDTATAFVNGERDGKAGKGPSAENYRNRTAYMNGWHQGRKRPQSTTGGRT